MKATLETPNTLFLALWTDKDAQGQRRTLAVGMLRARDGGIVPVGEVEGTDPLATLVTALEDMRELVARHIVIYTNNAKVAALYTRPVQLEPIAKDRQDLYDPKQWAALRLMCGYNSWQFYHKEKMNKVEAKWDQRFRKEPSNA